MRVLQWGWFAAAVLATGCVTTQQAEKRFTPGTKFQRTVSVGVGGQNIPLPDGVWEVAASKTTTNNHATPILFVILFQEVNSRLSKAMYFSTPLSGDPNGVGYLESKTCRRDNMHYRITDENVSGGDQDCRWVNHYRVTLKGSTTKLKGDAGEYLAKRGISYPNHLIESGHRFADVSSFLNVHYYFSPDYDGFEDYRRTTWSDSPWHPQNTSGSDNKNQYIRRIRTWTDKWHGMVKAGFAGALPTVSSVRSKPTVSAPNPAAKSGKVSERLERLKKLMKDGLITKDEYDQKRQTILDSL